MGQMRVAFRTPEEVLEFVNCMEKYPNDIDMKRGKFVIDAKSILGVIGLGLGSAVELQVHGEPSEGLSRDIQRYSVA